MHVSAMDKLLRRLLGPATDRPGEYGFTCAAAERVRAAAPDIGLVPIPENHGEFMPSQAVTWTS